MNKSDYIMYIIVAVIIIVIILLTEKQNRKSNKDLKDRGDLEKEIVERTEELRKARSEQIRELSKLAEFGRLSQGLFHDLMNPLSSLSLSIEKLSSIYPDQTDELKSKVRLAVSASKKMGEYMDAIRNNINPDTERRQYLIHESIDKNLKLLSYHARNLDVTITTNCTDISISCNPIHLDRVILNLLSNAIDSFESIQDNRDRNVVIRAEEMEGTIQVSVKDNGCGIPIENQGRIFDEFFSTKSMDRGSGIGLSITRSIIEQFLYGSIDVKSELNNGSLFTIILNKQ